MWDILHAWKYEAYEMSEKYVNHYIRPRKRKRKHEKNEMMDATDE